MEKSLFLFIILLPILLLGQQQYSESTSPGNMVTGVYFQSGPGSNNTLGWANPYGTKLSVISSIHRNFELATSSYPYGTLKLRQWDPTNNNWTTWRGIPIQNNNGEYEAHGNFKIGIPGDTREDSFLLLSRGSEGKDRALVSFGNDGDYKWHTGMLYGGGWQTPDFYISSRTEFRTGGSIVHEPEFTLTVAGDVGIGTRSPDAKLAVNGNIHAQEVKVDLVGWPDYVFSNNYKLPTLQEVEKHIQEKGHLPNIPSAKEVETNGIKLGEINKILLEKIEEMTLYILQLQEQIKRNTKMKSELDHLKKSYQDVLDRLQKLENK